MRLPAYARLDDRLASLLRDPPSDSPCNCLAASLRGISRARTQRVNENGSGGTLPVPIRTAALLTATGVALYLCWLIARPFLSVITWALALAVVAHPWHRWLDRRMGRTLAALMAVACVAIVLVVPALWLGQQLFQETSASLKRLGPELSPDALRVRLQHYPLLVATLERLDVTLNLDQEIGRAAGALAAKASSLVGISVWLITQLFLTFFTLFFFFRDRSQLLALLRGFAPISDTETTELFDRVSHTISACLYGTVVVKVVQGLLGGLMFSILGLPAPVLCGAAMALCAVLPVVGTALIWGPAAILLALGGHWVPALILAGWGILVVGLIDNVLYPLLVAGELRLHTLAVFFSILGGLIAFGPAGVVLGPVILAITGELLDVWRVKRINASDRSAEVPVREARDETPERVL